ncbi:MAG: TIGR01777 family oxidoreductase [Dehalococcoidia bacterium]|nr:TIGR01777 family oxidoreductase [Dehalococcoidia bacterium]MDW8008538.1 TIGR01777 family oxidoreductase [Chloroflexota bacterium]
MRVLVTGASGLIGSHLVPALEREGHQVLRLGRRPETADFVWDPLRGQMDARALEGVEAVVHLAGENIGQRWTPASKERIWRSRVEGTRLLAEAIAASPAPPKVFISASATGYYGDRGDEALDEGAAPGRGFLAELCQAWEQAAQTAAAAGTRVVNPRFGVVLSARGGALARLLPVFRLGLGGSLGSGRQYMSWVDMDDLVQAVLFLLSREEFSGPVNVTSPNPVTNAEFTRTLARVLGRPALFRVPAFALQVLLGEMAREALLSGQRVLPARLQAAGFQFRYPELEASLRHALGR